MMTGQAVLALAHAFKKGWLLCAFRSRVAFLLNIFLGKFRMVQFGFCNQSQFLFGRDDTSLYACWEMPI
tara:strand:- start:447 stop:653 length:207 start_codon:yes stop_codon:yes gene_type:complete